MKRKVTATTAATVKTRFCPFCAEAIANPRSRCGAKSPRVGRELSKQYVCTRGRGHAEGDGRAATEHVACGTSVCRLATWRSL